MSIKKYKTNQHIKAPIVRLIDQESGEMLGEFSAEKALEKAQKLNKDLVEVSPKAQPPVCKIMDYGQFAYQQKKTEQQHKKKQKQTEVKGIRLGFRIGEHDIEVKEKQARKFIESGNLLRVVMQFKGREMSHIELGLDKIRDFAVRLKDIAQIDQEPKRQGSQVIMILIPKK